MNWSGNGACISLKFESRVDRTEFRIYSWGHRWMANYTVCKFSALSLLILNPSNLIFSMTREWMVITSSPFLFFFPVLPQLHLLSNLEDMRSSSWPRDVKPQDWGIAFAPEPSGNWLFVPQSLCLNHHLNDLVSCFVCFIFMWNNSVESLCLG